MKNFKSKSVFTAALLAAVILLNSAAVYAEELITFPTETEYTQETSEPDTNFQSFTEPLENTAENISEESTEPSSDDTAAEATDEDSSVDPTEAPTEEEDTSIALDNYDVFEAVKVKRSIMNNEETYTNGQMKTLLKFLAKQKAIQERYVYYDTQGFGMEKYTNETDLDPDPAFPGSIYKFRPALLSREGYIHSGWMYQGQIYTSTSKFPMPEHDVYVTPQWIKSIKVTFFGGDFEDFTGAQSYTYTSTESITYYLPGSDKITRKGYTITGWQSSLDGSIYSPNEKIKLPDDDITFTAIWAPASYNVTMFANNGKLLDKYNIKVTFGENFIIPECTFEKEGYEFSYWKYDGNKYLPGDSLTIPALLNGEKIIISAVWKKVS